jgi:hypothetical protein
MHALERTWTRLEAAGAEDGRRCLSAEATLEADK